MYAALHIKENQSIVYCTTFNLRYTKYLHWYVFLVIRYIIFIIGKYVIIYYIKTHDSESRGQEEAGRMRRMSVLFTGNTAMKFVNALNKPP